MLNEFLLKERPLKTLNFSALSQITLGELSDFLRWMNQAPTGDITTRQLKASPPIRTSKLSSMLKILEDFGFIQVNSSHIAMSKSGHEFSRINLSGKMGVLRALLLNYEQVRTVMELLQNSRTGRLKARVVYYALKEGYEHLTELEMRGFISWAHWSELFHYDKKRDEICLIEGRSPFGPRQEASDVRAVS